MKIIKHVLLTLVVAAVTVFFSHMQARWESVSLRPVAARQQAMGQKWAHLQSQRKRPRKLMSAKKRTWWRTAVALGIPSVLLLLKLAAMYKNKKSTLSVISPAPTPEILPVATSFAVVSSPPQPVIPVLAPEAPVLTQHVELQSQQVSDALGLSTFVDQSTPPLMLPVESRLVPLSERVQLIAEPVLESLLYEAKNGCWEKFLRAAEQSSNLLIKDDAGKNVLHYLAERFMDTWKAGGVWSFGKGPNTIGECLKLSRWYIAHADNCSLLALEGDQGGKLPMAYFLEKATPESFNKIPVAVGEKRYPVTALDLFCGCLSRLCAEKPSLEMVSRAKNSFAHTISFFVNRCIESTNAALLMPFMDAVPLECLIDVVTCLMSSFNARMPQVHQLSTYQNVMAQVDRSFFYRDAIAYAARRMAAWRPYDLLAAIFQSVAPSSLIVSMVSSAAIIMNYEVPLFFMPRFIFHRLVQYGSRFSDDQCLNGFIAWCRDNPLTDEEMKRTSPWLTTQYNDAQRKQVDAVMEEASKVLMIASKERALRYDKAMRNFVAYLHKNKINLSAQDRYGQTLAHKGFLLPHDTIFDENWLTPRDAFRDEQGKCSYLNACDLFQYGLRSKALPW